MKKQLSRIFLVSVLLAISIVIIVRLVSPEKTTAKQKEELRTNVRESNELSIQDVDTSAEDIPVFRPAAYELPACSKEDIIKHVGYCLQYDEGNEQAKWVAYQLTEAETIKRFKRTDSFLPDPAVFTGSATDSDYKRSGYDRGHLAPAADMGWSAQAMQESFYYSNMSPQVPGFNRGIWKRLEEQVRSWAVELDTIYVVTGPVLSGKMNFIGTDHLAVPNYYYKAILYLHGKDSRSIGFLMANRASREDLSNYVVSVDSLEKVTGLDLFAAIDDPFEKTIENTVCSSCWNYSKTQTNQREQMQANDSQSVQCSGITRAGRRCKRMTRNPNGKCYQHQ
jgi:endonuclease G